MIKRVIELREIHKWTDKEVEAALDLCDEGLPTKLHSQGSFVAYIPDVVA
jgi:hypothetical protein